MEFGGQAFRIFSHRYLYIDKDETRGLSWKQWILLILQLLAVYIELHEAVGRRIISGFWIMCADSYNNKLWLGAKHDITFIWGFQLSHYIQVCIIDLVSLGLCIVTTWHECSGCGTDKGSYNFLRAVTLLGAVSKLIVLGEGSSAGWIGGGL